MTSMDELIEATKPDSDSSPFSAYALGIVAGISIRGARPLPLEIAREARRCSNVMDLVVLIELIKRSSEGEKACH
jgi:hypothetical protein